MRLLILTISPHILARAVSLAKDRDAAADDAALAEMGIDPTDWSIAAVRALTVSHP